MSDAPETEMMSATDHTSVPFLTEQPSDSMENPVAPKVPKKRKPRAKKVKVEASGETSTESVTETVTNGEMPVEASSDAKKPAKKTTSKARKTTKPKSPAKKTTAKKKTAVGTKSKTTAGTKKKTTAKKTATTKKKMEVAKIEKPLIQTETVASKQEPFVDSTLDKAESKATPTHVLKEKMEAIAAFSSAIVANAIPSRTATTSVPTKGSFWNHFTKPFQEIDQACEDENVSIKSAVNAFLVKDIIQALVFSSLIANWMNYESFSFVRMTFTETSWLFVRILLLFFAAEFAQAGIVYAIGKLMHKDCSYIRIVSAQSKSALDIGIAFIGFWLLSRISLPIGLVGLVAATCFAVMTYGYAYGKACKLESMQEALCNCASFAVKAILFGLWVNLLAGDVLRMIMSILS